MLLSCLPLAADMIYLIPEAVWQLVEDYLVDDDHSGAMKWLRFNLNPLVYVPTLTCVHLLVLSIVRLVLNVMFGIILAIRDL